MLSKEQLLIQAGAFFVRQGSFFPACVCGETLCFRNITELELRLSRSKRRWKNLLGKMRVFLSGLFAAPAPIGRPGSFSF